MSQKLIVEVNEAGLVVGEPQPYVEQIEVEQVEKVIMSQEELSWTQFIWPTILIIGVLIIVFKSIVLVKQQTVEVIERLGKFIRIARAGLSFRILFIDQIAGEMDLRVQELTVPVETKTNDNVFVNVGVSVQFFVNPEKVFDAFYKLEDAQKQISSYIFDVVRAEVPKLKLDEVFEKKETIALAIKSQLQATMDDFGYNIMQALITDIDPNEKVKVAMNEINAAQRLRVAATEKGEAEKIIQIKQAEAEAESKKLQGEGIANQRKAIVNGLQESVKAFESATGVSSAEVMNLVLLTQYFDTLKEVAGPNGATILLPHSPSAVADLSEQIRDAVIVGNQVKRK